MHAYTYLQFLESQANILAEDNSDDSLFLLHFFSVNMQNVQVNCKLYKIQ